jgi:phytanoyl-CoA hydroxylase
LSFAAGSHKRASVKERFIRVEGGTGFIPNEGSKYPAGADVEDAIDGEEEYTLGEVKAGTLVLIHGNLLHKSEKNVSQKGRIIYTFHVIEGENVYDGRNWLQPPKEGFSRLYT